ncbi:hypothetical protein NQ317_014396 [Molorchus minor]|uniref:Uncharacterized protein n=1 Tax=Molorchus minor TaxID=1323400 RepID=A0ABQ9K5A6_9CUCU|nr:hypothetical protein NQ317_014396 [Molorchus minor]
MVSNCLEKVFTPAQIQLLMGKKVFWSDDDLARAFTLRHMGGKELYLYLRNTVNLPLPSLSCIQNAVLRSIWMYKQQPDIRFRYQLLPFPKNEYLQQWRRGLWLEHSHLLTSFDELSYIEEITIEDGMAVYKKTLKEDAVPNLYLPPAITIKEQPPDVQDFKNLVVYSLNCTDNASTSTTSSTVHI